jgi:cytochrome c oxidase subunit IV
MTEQSHEHRPADHGHAQGGPSFQLYMNIFYALSVFTALSFVFNELARHDIISYMTSVALIVIVAVVKALCVATIFMHLKFDWRRVYCIIIPVSIMAVMMVIVLLPDIVLSWHHGLYEPPAHAQVIEGTPGH